MKKYQKFIYLFLFACILCACSNIPQAPTKTPTMSAEEMMAAAQETAEAMRAATETQWAVDNPSPTPTETSTPTPEATPTSALPQIPPTATSAPLPYLSVGYTNVTIYKIGNPSDYTFVPTDNLYIEVCYTNAGSGIWNENYYAVVSNKDRANIQPEDIVRLGKNVENGEKACFSFQRIGSTDTALRTYCPGFQLYTDGGAAMRNGYVSACFTIQ